MNTQIVMSVSAFVLGITGVALSFLPQEIAHIMSLPRESYLIFQLLGALYFGFAMINWTAKRNLIGGIYGKPISMGNMIHFVIGALASIKFLSKNTELIYLWVFSLIYVAFAILFSYISFTHPKLVSEMNAK